ncbi:ArsR/SmtB family transcription factor [Amycolatopsis nigrescens]|uniref:ArsR/SmtB family transcription factor n=1 Tax=Amycolatopsis nigrescens TaxID=381445 RepID=UPI000370F571|nr:helix-turn-helix transcriptional regulator [Amycolatopsis nigrescens]
MGTDFAAVARLLANPARSAVVDALQAGRPLAAGELAQLAGVRPSTTSEHLTMLVQGGLLTVVHAGRHRYYQLAGTAVSDALEALSHICPATPVRSLRQASAARTYQYARTCYDHLAGALGVALLDAMLDREWLAPGDPDYTLTPSGATELGRLGVDLAACRRSRRQFARPCLDWTQRRPHLAGALGAAITATLNTHGWLRPGSPNRGVRITTTGQTRLHTTFGIDTTALTTSNDS